MRLVWDAKIGPSCHSSQPVKVRKKIWYGCLLLPCASKEEMHVIDWAEAQNEDPVIQKTIEWIRSKKNKSLKYYLGDHASTPEGMGFISRQKFLVLINGKLYLNCKLKGEAKTTTVFVILRAHRQKAIDGCH